jgi:hypothetical protein
MKLTTLALSAALALSATASLAQPPAPPPGAPGPNAEGRHWQRPDPAEMAARHAQHLRDALQLRPDQEPALQAFVAALKPPAGDRDRDGERRGPEAGPMTVLERLDREQARMVQHEQRFRARAEATRRFYAQLSPAQQKAFDAMPMGMGRGMRGRDGFRGGPGRGGPGGPGFGR